MFDRLLISQCFLQCFLYVTCSDKVEELRPQWLSCDKLDRHSETLHDHRLLMTRLTSILSSHSPLR